MEPRTRRISALATAAVLGLPAATAAVPALGIVGGMVASVAIAAGGIAGFLMMVPETMPAQSPRQRLNPDVRASFDVLVATFDKIERTEVKASLRHSAQTLLQITNNSYATVADMSFVILNMESLVGIAEAWQKTEALVADPASGDTLASFTITTIADVTRNAHLRHDMLRKQSRDSLQVELAVTRRIIDEDRKGMQP